VNGTWHRIDIAGKPADVYELAGGASPRFGILYLHPFGLETLVGNVSFTRLFDELHLACVCPHGQRCWWTDRLCPEFDERITAERYLLDQVLPFFDARWSMAPPRIGVLGISMGGQGALRLGFKHPRIFPVVAGISSAIEYHNLYGEGTAIDEMYDSKEQCRQDTVLLHIHPTDYPPHILFSIDPTDVDWYRGNDRLHEKLAALGIAHSSDLSTRAGGHSWAYFNATAEPAVRFVHAGLQEMSRRLL
jgi:S-formylglutathione hydrolase